MAKSSATKKSSAISPVQRGYLLLFNVVSLLGWSYCFFLLLNVLTKDLKWTSLLSPQGLSRLHYVKAFHAVRFPLCYVQSLALFEVIHAALKLVRAPVTTTAAQVASRFFLTWGIVYVFGNKSVALQQSPAFTTMVVAWSLAEMLRYGYYADHLASNGADDTPAWLIWLRYSAFFVLYPVGVLSELTLVYTVLPVASLVHALLPYTFIAIMLVYAPGFYVLFTHMLKQRKKYLSGQLTVSTQADADESESSGSRGRSNSRRGDSRPTTPSRASPRRRSTAKKDE